MEAQVLVDSAAFKSRFETLAAQAKESIYIQAMSFEGDTVGEWLIDVLIRSPAKDIQLCLDSYSKFVINDQFIYSLNYLKDRDFRAEVKNTSKLVKKAQLHGIKVKYVNPLGFLFLKYPHRNHKKMVVIDEAIAFIGGLNFCEHNFSWHDMMIEMHHNEVAASLAKDFRCSMAENDQSNQEHFGDIQMYYLDGYRSKALYEKIFHHIRTAKESIQIFSPYVSDPLLGYIRRHKPAQVSVDIISPVVNNKPIFKTLLANELLKSYFHYHEYQKGMSHLKAILIDEKKLMTGSSNFDLISYYFEEEVVMITENPTIVQSFIHEVAVPDKRHSFFKAKLGVRRNFVVSCLFASIGRLCHVAAKLTHK